MTRVCLERIAHEVGARCHPAANVRRFYYAFVGQTFCGPVCVVRIHGRKGVWQRTLPPVEFEDEAAAGRWLQRLHRRKLLRGYLEVATR
jgi:predicted DNA-binding WGR domain protein